MTQFTCKGVKQINNRISFTFVSLGVFHQRGSSKFSEILIAKCRSRFYCTWFFCWGDIVREINVSHAWDPVHAGDKALRGRVNRYVYVFTFESVEYTHVVQQNKHCCVVLLLFYVFVIFILQGRSYFQKWFNFLRSRDVKGYVELHFCICITWTLVIICCRCCYK